MTSTSPQSLSPALDAQPDVEPTGETPGISRLALQSRPCLGVSPVGSGEPTYETPGKIRVLHVINGEHYAGAERVQDLLASRLPDFGFEVGFACLKAAKFPRARQCQSAPLFELPMWSKFDLRIVRRVVEILRTENYKLIHAHTPRSALIARAAAALAKVPMIYHVHSPTSRDTTHGLRNLVNHWTERVSLVGVDALVTVSQSLRQHMLRQGYRSERVTTIPNGVPISLQLRSGKTPTGTWTLGMTALFRPRKGLEVLLDAIQILRSQQFPVRLQAVGPFETAEYERAIRARVERLGISESVTWTGFTSNVAAELTQMDLFVLPSLFGEGLPMVVLEAMAAGVPVVASRVEGVPEAIEHGVSGLLAKPNDPAELADCIQAVIQGEFSWSAMRQCALSKHSTEFSDHRMAERLAELYNRILKSR